MLDETEIYNLLAQQAETTIYRLRANRNIPQMDVEVLQQELRQLLHMAAKNVAHQRPSLSGVTLAQRNLNHLLYEIERPTIELRATQVSLRDALRGLCPIFPFC